jgi:AraC-like DNA-binding protein
MSRHGMTAAHHAQHLPQPRMERRLATRRQAAKRQSEETTVRVGGALGITAVLRDLGVDPVEVLTDAGIDPALFDDPDNLITYRARGRLFTRSVLRTGCQHFGLMVGQRMNLESLGLVGLLARNSPDVRSALDHLVNYLHLHARGAVVKLTVEHNRAIWTYASYQAGVEATDQTGDGAVALMLNVMRSLCGPDFRPTEAWFAHRRPADVGPFRRLLQAPLMFDAEHFALVFSHDWLDVRLPDVNLELLRLLQKQVVALEARHGDEFPEIVRSVLRSALLTGHADAKQIAALLSMHTRTLSRRLEGFGTGLRQLIDEGRFEIARQMLEDTSLEISQIAESLGYARASVFARAFRRWSGMTPTAWRKNRAVVT